MRSYGISACSFRALRTPLGAAFKPPKRAAMSTDPLYQSCPSVFGCRVAIKGPVIRLGQRCQAADFREAPGVVLDRAPNGAQFGQRRAGQLRAQGRGFRADPFYQPGPLVLRGKGAAHAALLTFNGIASSLRDRFHSQHQPGRRGAADQCWPGGVANGVRLLAPQGLTAARAGRP